MNGGVWMTQKNVMVIKLTKLNDNYTKEEIKSCAEKHWRLSDKRRDIELRTVDYVIVMHHQVAIAEYQLTGWGLSDPSEHDDTKHARYRLELEESDETGLINQAFDYPTGYPVTLTTLDELKMKVK